MRAPVSVVAIQLTLATQVRVGREEASRPDMVAEVVGRVLADRKGSYCRDLKGWLVSATFLRMI